MQHVLDNLALELVKKYYEKGYCQGKLDEKDGIYIDKAQLSRAIEDDLTREMRNLTFLNIGS